MLFFHLFTWDMRTEGLFVLWGLALLVGLVLFRSREQVAETVCVTGAVAPAAPVVKPVTKPRYVRSFAGYGLG
jgi:hypothetical protein